MAVPAYDMVTWRGVFGTAVAPVEEWSFSVKFEGQDNVNDETANAFTAKEGYRLQLAPLFAPWVVLTNTRYSRHAAGGLVERNAEGGYVQADDTTVVAGTGPQTGRAPTQTSVCVSLDTERAGPEGKGRFFLPQPAFDLGLDFRLSVADTTTIADNVREMLDGFAAFGRPVVASSKGFRSAVTGVRCGRVVDTIRTRRRSMIEAYVASDLVTNL